MSSSYECLIIGGGVIGLSLARELAGRGVHVAVVERDKMGRAASWAGAGILPPGNLDTAVHPLDQLRGLSTRLHAEWADELREETGIDNGYRPCGGLYLARSAGEAASLRGMMLTWAEEQVEVRRLEPEEAVAREPQLRSLHESGQLRACYLLPGEAQLRNPRHLKALAASCRQRGVELIEDCEVTGWEVRGDQVTRIQTAREPVQAERICVCSGAWTRLLLDQLQIANAIIPIRGQMVLLSCPEPPLRHILNEGSRYIVPREDGHVLVGSTEEEVGYEIANSSEGIAQLMQFARALAPVLGESPIERTWAGLRPGSVDGFPYLGRLPGFRNMYVAAGHFRSGLYLSPATALVMSDLLCGSAPRIDLTPFSVLRSGLA